MVGLSFLWAAAAGLSWAEGGFTARFLCTALGGLGIYAIVSSRLVLRRAEADTRISAEKLTAGHSLHVHVTVRLRTFFPVAFLAARDVWTNSQGQDVYCGKRMLYPWFRKTAEYRYTVGDMRRGVYDGHRVELTAGDVFGLLTWSRALPSPASVTVFPQPWEPGELAVYQENGRRSPLDRRGDQWSPLLRDYASGDPMRLIHWKSSAKTGEWKSRQTEANPEGEAAFLLVDDSIVSEEWPSGFAGAWEERNPLFEASLRSAAGLLELAARMGKPVALSLDGTDFRERGIVPVPVLSREAGMDRLASAIPRRKTDVRAETKPPLEAEAPSRIYGARGKLPAGAALLCVTAAPDEALAVRLAEAIQQKQAVHVIHVLPAGNKQLEAEAGVWRQRLTTTGCGYTTLAIPAATPAAGKGKEAVDHELLA